MTNNFFFIIVHILSKIRASVLPFVFRFLLLGAIITLKQTLVMLKILQKYCLNFNHVPKEILHKNIFLLHFYSS